MKRLIIPDNDPSQYKNMTITPSGLDVTTEKGLGIDSNKDIGHAMSLEDIGHTLATNSVDTRTIN